MKSLLHGLAGALALLCILSFWVATTVAELFLDTAAVVSVKNAVLQGMYLLLPAMVIAGGSGFALGRQHRSRWVRTKGRRMRIVAANGLLVLLPSAWLLATWAHAGRLDLGFYTLQALELLAGAINITLLTLNLRDGLRLARQRALQTATR
jgi:hypothetical protein